MSSISDQRFSSGLKFKLLDEEKAARSVVISNLAPQTTNESITIHFQRQKNGGGDIDCVYIPKKGTAVITFDSREVIETVLEHSHTLDESALKIRRFISDDSPEVFHRVTARLNFDRFQLLPQQSQKALKVLRDKAEVECRSVSFKECVISGTFTQIESAQKLLKGFFQQCSSVLQQLEAENKTFHYGDTTQTQQSSAETWDSKAGDDDVSSLEVQPQFMKLLKRVYKRKLLEIEEKYGVEIVWKDNATHVQLHPGTIPSNPRSYQKGCDAFIDLYQNFFPNMCREEVELKHADDGALEAINSVEAENDVVIEKVGNKLVVYAERNKITSSVQALKENLGLPQSSRKTRRSQKSTNFGAQEHNETTREHRFSALAATVLKQLLSNRVNFSLHQGDITDERADAIVNAANEWLSHGGGVAAAIVRKGGHQIEEESRGIMLKRNRRPLDVGDAVNTSGGNLPCRFVIHTVGPRWSEWDSRESILLLRRACMESLRLAAELELCSIALPAISSGIFGMPKDICAQVMFEAIEEFSSSTDTKISTLRDVRIVIIDDETISFFREEFVRRYTSQEASPPNLQHEERPPNKEREVALKTTPELPPYSSADDPFAKQAKKSGEAGDVKTPNDGVGSEEKSRDKPKELLDGIKEVHPSNNDIPNTKEASPITAIKPPDVESEDSGTNKETGLEGSASVQRTKLSNVNTAPKPPSSMGRGALAAKETSPPNSPHEERPPNKDGEVALKATPEVPPFSSADDPFAIQPKKSREAGDVKTPHYGVGSEEKSSDEPKEVLDGIKEMHPSDDGIPYTKKVSPITGIKLPDVESEDSRTDKGAGLGGFASVKRSELSNINTAAKPPSGRGRGVLAAKFPGKQLREPGPKSSGGAQLREKGGPMNVDAGRGRGMTCATTSNAPPGLVLTDEGKRLARDHREQLRNNLNTEPDGSMKVNLEAGENGSNKEYLKEENQESKHSNRKTDGDKLDSEYPQGHSEDHDTSNLSQLDKDDASGSKLPPSDKTTDSQETEKTTTSEADRRGKLLTSMDKPRQAKSEAVIRIQVDQPSSDPTNDKTTYPEPSLPSNQSGTSPETKVVISTASHASVSGNEKDTLEGKRTSELPTALTSADGAPLKKTHGVHPTNESNCVMCMNLSKDPVYPLQCGHYFCKSCLKRFIEKTKSCPKCKQENVSRGNQPVGYMTWRTESHNSLPGYEDCGTIAVTYNFSEGIQGPEHPFPGEPYCGLFFTSYLPSSPAGQELCNLLRRAFDERLIFTIGRCPATGEENKIVWNGIEMKTSRGGGPANYGYPDPSYLDRATRQLAEKGILTQQHNESNQ